MRVLPQHAARPKTSLQVSEDFNNKTHQTKRALRSFKLDFFYFFFLELHILFFCSWGVFRHQPCLVIAGRQLSSYFTPNLQNWQNVCSNIGRPWAPSWCRDAFSLRFCNFSFTSSVEQYNFSLSCFALHPPGSVLKMLCEVSFWWIWSCLVGSFLCLLKNNCVS